MWVAGRRIMSAFGRGVGGTLRVPLVLLTAMEGVMAGMAVVGVEAVEEEGWEDSRVSRRFVGICR